MTTYIVRLYDPILQLWIEDSTTYEDYETAQIRAEAWHMTKIKTKIVKEK